MSPTAQQHARPQARRRAAQPAPDQPAEESRPRSLAERAPAADRGADLLADEAQLEDAAPVDGRTLRARRTRDAVVEALLALQEEGDLAPTAQRVAARAGVALRTVYGHFSDMEALWLEAGRRELEKITALADVPPAHLPLAERVERYCASRARVLEALLPVMRATRLRRPSSAQLDRNWALYVSVGDEEVSAVFRPELDRLDPAARRALLDGLYLVSSSPAWDALRDDRRLDPDAAHDVVRASVWALLTPHLDADPDREGPR